jgi:hypothetical protein
MTVSVTKPAINLREELADLRKPTGVAGEAMLRAETPQEQFNLIGAGRRNLLINGGMQIAQRGATFATVSAGTFTLDRWKIEGGNYAAAFTISQEADAPTGLKNCLKVDVTTADASTASNEYSYLHYLVEGYDAAAAGFGNADGKPVTISFWHKHTAAGEYSVSIRNADSTRSIVGAYYQKSSDTWEYSTITFPPCPDGTWTTASDRGFRIGFAITMGSLYHASEGVWSTSTKLSTANQVNVFADTANNFRITGVQLELGKVATPFEHRSYGEELALCQRYFERISSEGNSRSLFAAGYNESTSTARWILNYEKKRSAPTINDGGGVSNFGILHTSTTLSLNTLTFDQATTRSCRCLGESTGTPLTDGGGSILCSVDSDVAYIDIDSEL